jgi:hypothetical protein
MEAKSLSFSPIGWVFGTIVLAIGVANLVLVHPVPGVAFLLLSLVYFPTANEFFLKQTGFMIPRFVKIALGIVIIMFTLGVSDLGDIIDGLSRTA